MGPGVSKVAVIRFFYPKLTIATYEIKKAVSSLHTVHFFQKGPSEKHTPHDKDIKVSYNSLSLPYTIHLLFSTLSKHYMVINTTNYKAQATITQQFRRKKLRRSLYPSMHLHCNSLLSGSGLQV